MLKIKVHVKVVKSGTVNDVTFTVNGVVISPNTDGSYDFTVHPGTYVVKARIEGTAGGSITATIIVPGQPNQTVVDSIPDGMTEAWSADETLTVGGGA